MRPPLDSEAVRLGSLALFLDVDGTLLEIAATPDAVRVEPQLRTLLRSLYFRTAGAIALISGRSIAALDELFAPMSSLAAAGLHGFERRGGTGSYFRRPLPDGAVLQLARVGLRDIAARHPGVFVEDKRFALALHYRLAQESELELLHEVELIAGRVRPQLQLQLGKMVAELRPATATKGAAVREFLREPPFCGRWPIYIGDDLTDETAFECINAVGGVSIAVNMRRPTVARFCLPEVGAVHAWLAALPAGLPERAAVVPVLQNEMRQSIPLHF
jgi:trehalose 6-phosphate phosphatase